MAYTIDDACDGCSACARRCPVQAISGERRQTFTISPSLCIDCSACGAVCPRGAVRDSLGQAVDQVPRSQRGRPVFDPDRCNGCGMCDTLCPFDCIRVAGAPYQGVAVLAAPKRCVSCGECVSICAKGAVDLVALDMGALDPVHAWDQAHEVLARTADPSEPLPNPSTRPSDD